MGPEHTLTLEEVLRAYTINSAWSLNFEEATGSIEEGRFAGSEFEHRSEAEMARMGGGHDYRDVRSRATQEQLPRMPRIILHGPPIFFFCKSRCL